MSMCICSCMLCLCGKKSLQGTCCSWASHYDARERVSVTQGQPHQLTIVQTIAQSAAIVPAHTFEMGNNGTQPRTEIACMPTHHTSSCNVAVYENGMRNTGSIAEPETKPIGSLGSGGA